jgi:integrase
MPSNPILRLVKSAPLKRAVRPLRRPNSELRSREHLTETEVLKLIETARGNRHGHRDATMILIAYRHGFRASEICDLRWEQFDFNSATLHVRRITVMGALDQEYVTQLIGMFKAKGLGICVARLLPSGRHADATYEIPGSLLAADEVELFKEALGNLDLSVG